MSSSSVPCLADRMLIEQVRLHEVLYAVTTKSNRDNQLRDRAWIEIASTLDRSGKIFLYETRSFSVLSRFNSIMTPMENEMLLKMK